jgi:hypothetical protein
LVGLASLDIIVNMFKALRRFIWFICVVEVGEILLKRYIETFISDLPQYTLARERKLTICTSRRRVRRQQENKEDGKGLRFADSDIFILPKI